MNHLLRTSIRALSRPVFRNTVAAAAAPRVAPRFVPMARPLAMKSARFMSSGTIDSDLTHKLEEEIQYEKANDEGTPEFVQEFLQANSFQIDDKPGHDEVTLTRTFGNEKIRILFSISDINNLQTDDEFLAAQEGESEGEEILPQSFPVRASVVIEKDGKGALTVDTMAMDGEISIESIVFYNDNKLATEQSSEADWQRRGLYVGPQFTELDENLQSLFLQYLEERGVNAGLATFLPDYIEYKEQKEYMRWLESVKKFVTA